MPRTTVACPAGMRLPVCRLVMKARIAKRWMGMVACGWVPGATQWQSLSGMRYAVFIQ